MSGKSRRCWMRSVRRILRAGFRIGKNKKRDVKKGKKKGRSPNKKKGRSPK
jgi:hypothetical protein